MVAHPSGWVSGANNEQTVKKCGTMDVDNRRFYLSMADFV